MGLAPPTAMALLFFMVFKKVDEQLFDIDQDNKSTFAKQFVRLFFILWTLIMKMLIGGRYSLRTTQSKGARYD